MAHVHKLHEGHRNILDRAYSSALLSSVIASLLIACGGPTLPDGSAAPAGTTTPPPAPGADTTPPTAPTGLAALANGSFGAALSWTASTDNVAVTGYKVERCLGAGCATFAQVATAAGASFTDSGLTAATSYSYQVRATDAAANLSAFSNIANITTAVAPPPPLPNLPVWMTGLAIGQWFAIPNTSISSADPATTPNGNWGPQSKIFAWNSVVVDTRTSKVYSVAGGGHQDYSGNEVDVLDLEVALPAWSQVLAPTPNSQLLDCQSYYADEIGRAHV